VAQGVPLNDPQWWERPTVLDQHARIRTNGWPRFIR